MFVIPNEGLKIVDPKRHDYLPAEGRNVGHDAPLYWDRHVRDGSLTVIQESETEKFKAALATAEEAEKARNLAHEEATKKAAEEAKAALQPKPAETPAAAPAPSPAPEAE